MSKVMLINVSHEEESRVAILGAGILDSLEIENVSRSLKGNIYKAVVNNVNAALEAAFVDYGGERGAFLPLDEVNFKVLPALHGREGHRRGRITEHLAPGREVLVQVVRDAFNTKPPTVSTFYSLPGRYLVLTPHSDGQGISRKIEDLDQRDRLRRIVEELNPPDGYGLIVRTAGMDQTKTELQRDLRYLLRLWEAIEAAAAVHRAPAFIYQERDVVLRTIRDHFTADIEEVLIDDPEVYEKARRFVQTVMPGKEKIFKLYTGDRPLFSKYNLEDQIESIFRREVPLPSGGVLVIDETEALTAVDVNSARSAREGNVEDMALRTNLEAGAEVARQLRLRDLGGLIVIDFIDMYQEKNVRAVEKVVREALKKDRAKCDISRISKFGLMEISRQRLKMAKALTSYTPCSRCEGTGVVKTTEAAALSILRRIQARVVKGDLGMLRANVPEEVAVYLLNQKRAELSALESRYGTRILVIPQAAMNPSRAEFDTTIREPAGEGAPPPPKRPAAETTRAETPAAWEQALPPETEEDRPPAGPEARNLREGALRDRDRPPAGPEAPGTVATAGEGPEPSAAQPSHTAEEESPRAGHATKRRRRRRRRPGRQEGEAPVPADSHGEGPGLDVQGRLEPSDRTRELDVAADVSAPAGGMEVPGWCDQPAGVFEPSPTASPGAWAEYDGSGEGEDAAAGPPEPLWDAPGDYPDAEAPTGSAATTGAAPPGSQPRALGRAAGAEVDSPVSGMPSRGSERESSAEPEMSGGSARWDDVATLEAESEGDEEIEEAPAHGHQGGPPLAPGRRRRRRRRRSRRGGAGPIAAEVPGAESRGAGIQPAEQAPRGHAEGPAAAPTRAAEHGGATQHGPQGANAPRSKPEEGGAEEEIPGGWWQRLTGGSRRTGGRGGGSQEAEEDDED